MAPKTREINIDVDKHLNDPETIRVQEELSRLVKQADEQIEDHIIQEENEEERFTSQPQMLKRPKAVGPLANRGNQDRIKRTEEMLNRKEKAGELPIRRSFDPNVEETPEREPITNAVRPRNTGAPVEPPEISTLQRLEKKLKDQEKEIQLLKQRDSATTPVEDPKQPSRLASRRVKYDSKYVKIIPPSNFMFYDFDPDDFQVKKIDIVTQEAITNARRTRDFSAYIDALSSTLLNVDLRDLTPDDWFYFLYWHRFNSYNRTPLVFTWLSKYGNKNNYSIQESDIRYINPIISTEEWNEYKKLGLRIPTLRDWELLNTNNDFDQDDLNIYLKAQYFQGDTIEDKVDNYFSKGETVETLEMISELKVKTHHGVVDTVDVVDNLFDPETYLNVRKQHVENLKTEMENYRENTALFFSYKEEVEEIEEEISEKELTLKNGGQVRPEVETHPVRFNALDIFPFL